MKDSGLATEFKSRLFPYKAVQPQITCSLFVSIYLSENRNDSNGSSSYSIELWSVV